jgi:PAS domain S-box-containing protein
LDYRRLFITSPTPFLILAPDAPRFTIKEVNQAYLAATMRTRNALIGRPLFEAFPNNPDDSGATGVANLRASLERALATKRPNTMAVQKYDIPHPRGGFEERWWDPVNTPVLDEAGEVAEIVHHVTDVTRRQRAERALHESEARWREVFERMDEGFEIDEMILGPDGRAVDLRYVEVNAAWERHLGIPREMIVGRRATEMFPPEETEFWVPLYGRVAETGEPARIERYVAPVRRWLELIAYRLQAGRVAVLLRDVTARHAAEERQALLSREVDHRAKNVLAVVQAALRLTRAPNVPSYVRAIEGRVAALARAQTLLADDRWAGADLLTLLRGELAAFLDAEARPRAELGGPAVTLPAGAAQPFAMAVHELGTNAVKYGALSVPGGCVRVTWELESGSAGRLRFRWTEEGGPRIEREPERSGFGTRVLDSTVRGQLGGTMALAWEASGLVCEIKVPLARAAGASGAAGD